MAKRLVASCRVRIGARLVAKRDTRSTLPSGHAMLTPDVERQRLVPERPEDASSAVERAVPARSSLGQRITGVLVVGGFVRHLGAIISAVAVAGFVLWASEQ